MISRFANITLAVLLVVGVVLVGPRKAAGCECSNAVTIKPNEDAANVPTNTKVWVDARWGCDEPALQDVSAQPVAVTQTTIGSDLRVLQPAEPLQSGATYTVKCEQSSYDTSFSVGGGSDETKPVLPTAMPGDLKESSLGDSCGDWAYIPMNVSHDGDVLVLDIAGRTTLSPESLAGNVVDVFMGEVWFVGSKPCNDNWSFDDDGEAVGVRFASFDLAGNFSGWSTPRDLSVGCSCVLVGDRRGGERGALWLGAVVALAMASARRRLRKRGG